MKVISGRLLIEGQAYKCKIPPEECPVLCKRAELEEQEKAEKENGEEVTDGE